MNKIRFQSAVSNTRSRGERVIEAYSPKLGRRLQCFGEHVFVEWLRLEADPTIQAFCERPAYSVVTAYSGERDRYALDDVTFSDYNPIGHDVSV